MNQKIEFYTVYSEPRPVRLREQTRRFAYESQHGKYGDEAMRTPAVAMDDVEGFLEMSEVERYDAAIAKIAAEAPIRICPEEQVSGAATLGWGIRHLVPASYRGEELWGSVSHLTLGFDRVVYDGMDALDAQVAARLQDQSLTASQCAQIVSMQRVIASMRVWHRRYMDALKETKPDVYARLLQVPFGPARDFREAVQSLWFTFAFTRLCGNWPGIGHIDQMLGGFLERDLADGTITIEEAREFLASFFIKGCEWIEKDTQPSSGDAQHYQNIVLAGVDEHGVEVTNTATYLVLDIVEELGISDFPISVRISERTPPALLRRIAEVMRHGGGVVAVYNEPLILDSLVSFGYPLKEARRFANDGCWEVQIPGKTLFHYRAFDSLQLLLENTLRLSQETPAHFDSSEQLYQAFLENLKAKIEEIYKTDVINFTGQEPGHDWQWKESIPCSVVSLLEEGCIESGRTYLAGGPVYTVISPHIGGAPDVGNSLYAIEKLVFEEKKVSFDELMHILQQNWEGYEPLRQYVKNSYSYYGNDNDEADRYTARVLDDFAALVEPLNGRCPIRFPAGVSTFGRQIEWAPARAATPFGSKRGEILSGNTSPTPGTDAAGATAVIRSYCKADLKKQVNGAALDVKLYPGTVEGENGVAALMALMQGFVRLGGCFMQLDIMDAEVLRQAQEHPEQYKTLSVRVSGWNARFVTLDREWQQMIIERSSQKV